jgi:chemotaxis protein MotB
MGEIEQVRIVRRRKAAEVATHHGGAWKVAYADFVTAMMAFFLLMWLLNATTEEQRKGLADYFSPSIPVHRMSGGGDGPFGGDNVFAEDTLIRDGTGATDKNPAEENRASGASGTSQADNPSLEEVEQALEAMSGESDVADALLRHVRTRLTDEGLIIEIFELPEARLFAAENDAPTARLGQILAMVTLAGNLVTNDVAVAAHLRTVPLKDLTYDGWNRSSERALHIRELLIDTGIGPARFAKVTGKADKFPTEADPLDIRNSRVEVILLRDGANLKS